MPTSIYHIGGKMEISQEQITQISHQLKGSGYLEWLLEEIRRKAYVNFASLPISDLDGMQYAKMMHDTANEVERIIKRHTIIKK